MPSPYNTRSKSSPSPRKPIHGSPNKESDDLATDDESEDSNMDVDVSVDSQRSSSKEKTKADTSVDDISADKKKTPKKKESMIRENSNRRTTAKASPTTHLKSTAKNQTKEASFSSVSAIFYIITIAVAIIGYLLYGIMFPPVPQENVPDKQLIETFNEEMKSLKEIFPSQSAKFWKIIKVSLKQIIINENPIKPAVLLLVVPSGSKASLTGTCIASRLTKLINNIFNVTSAKVIDIPKDISHRSPDDEKKDLDNCIKDSFQNRQLRSIAVDHFEQLSPPASLLFHGYCDGDNAPFKNVAIVFILHTSLDKRSLDSDHTLIDKHLMRLWSGTDNPLDRDKIDPLIARIANNAPVVTQEDKLECQ